MSVMKRKNSIEKCSCLTKTTRGFESYFLDRCNFFIDTGSILHGLDISTVVMCCVWGLA